jgi:polar amino acid transport system permease protein
MTLVAALSWDWHFAWQILPSLLHGLKITVEASLMASAIALVLGLLVAIARYVGVRIVGAMLRLAIDFIRGTPLLVQLYFMFYVLPNFHLGMSPLTTGVVTLGLNYSAYTAEVYRAGLENVPKDQWDAVRALNLPPVRAWTRIIIPQAVRSILPALGNYIIAMFKDSVLLSVIAVPELLSQAQSAATISYRYLEPMTLVGLFFLGISYPAALLVRLLERRLAANIGHAARA